MVTNRIPIPSRKSDIPIQVKPKDEKIKFTFEYLIMPEGFDYHNTSIKICEFIDRLHHHSTQKKIEFITDYSKSTRNHSVKEPKIVKAMAIDMLKDLSSENIYQFKMGGKGRIFGFFINELFVVRLIDVNHIGYSKGSR